MLPDSFREAPKALKDQATVATAMIVDDNRLAKRADLADTQRRMARYSAECKQIVRVVMRSTDKTLTIDSLDDDRLAKELGYT